MFRESNISKKGPLLIWIFSLKKFPKKEHRTFYAIRTNFFHFLPLMPFSNLILRAIKLSMIVTQNFIKNLSTSNAFSRSKYYRLLNMKKPKKPVYDMWYGSPTINTSSVYTLHSLKRDDLAAHGRFHNESIRHEITEKVRHQYKIFLKSANLDIHSM